MEVRSTRAARRKQIADGRVVKDALKRVRTAIESSGGEDTELRLPIDIIEDSEMADAM